jgi:hypothetical protein
VLFFLRLLSPIIELILPPFNYPATLHPAYPIISFSRYGNALQAAAYRGHGTVVQLLLDNEADISAQGGEYGNAL